MTAPVDWQAIGGVLFDKDGTLIDFQASWAAWAAGLLHDLAGGDAELRARLDARLGLDRSAPALAPDSPAVAGTAADVAACLAPLLPRWTTGALERHVVDTSLGVRPVPLAPLRPLLAGLRAAGLAVGLATNDTKAAAQDQLAALQIDDLFDFVAGYDSGHGPKPGPGMARAFTETLGLAPARACIIGDSAHDMAAGRAAGLACVAVASGPAGRGDFCRMADAVLPDITHLPDLLGLPRAG